MRLTIKQKFFGFTVFRGLRKDELQLREAAHLACDLTDAKESSLQRKGLLRDALALATRMNNDWFAQTVAMRNERDSAHGQAQKWAQLCGDNNAETLADIEKLMPILERLADFKTIEECWLDGEFEKRAKWLSVEIKTARELLAKFKAKGGAK